MLSLRGSVGLGGKNHATDVMVIQYLLNLNHATAGIPSELAVDGFLQREAVDGIKKFQKDVGRMVTPDGNVGVGGGTFNKLVAAASGSATPLTALRKVMAATTSGPYVRPGERSSGLGIINSQWFLELYASEFGMLTQTKLSALGTLLGFINDDSDVTDVGWGAYMLATVKHECAETWQPIEEYGKGSGHSYGNAVTITDPATKQTHANRYYGRGYVQLTWEANYKSVGNAIGLGNDLWINPALALDAQVAYAIMSYGMRAGSFTGKKLSTYIYSAGCDYQQARRIINGTDQAAKIAGYAERLELLLRASCSSSYSSCF